MSILVISPRRCGSGYRCFAAHGRWPVADMRPTSTKQILQRIGINRGVCAVLGLPTGRS